MSIPSLKKLIKKIFQQRRLNENSPLSKEWLSLQQLIDSSKTMVDLGCGTSPHPQASVAVDAFIQPIHRQAGYGPVIDADKFDGCKFILADLGKLPFSDKKFDFAYSHHVFEHLSDPKSACKEIMRIATGGVIVTPSPFAEIAFGRPYHLWLVFSSGNTILFVQKKQVEDCPFGEHPVLEGSKWKATEKTNPFDMLLNDGNWYKGTETMPRLSKKLRHLWYGRSPIVDTIFTWKGNFNCIVVHEDGRIE
jgi:SAM-dependent methyltransferase